MTKFSNPTTETILGPFSYWPRRRVSTRVMLAGAAMSTAIFFHCIAPVL